MSPRLSRPRLAKLASTASSVVLVLALCSCQTTGLSDNSDVTGSLGDKADVSAGADPRAAIELYRDRYRADPKDADVALQYGKALRAAGERAQAVAVLEQASIAHPGNKALLAAYGRALADNGNFDMAFEVLSKAHSPDDPDWHILSAQGAVLDQLGRYDEARQYYASALKIMPDDPSVLSNLGLSYLLSKDLPKAEETLRRAYGHANADPRVRMNLAVVLGLEGHMAEAEAIVKTGVPADQANADVAYLKRILSRKDARAEADKIPVSAPTHGN